MKEVTISSGSSVKMTSVFRIIKKSMAVHVAAEDYKHWPGVIEILEPVPERGGRQNVPIIVRTQ